MVMIMNNNDEIDFVYLYKKCHYYTLYKVKRKCLIATYLQYIKNRRNSI